MSIRGNVCKEALEPGVVQGQGEGLSFNACRKQLMTFGKGRYRYEDIYPVVRLRLRALTCQEFSATGPFEVHQRPAPGI